MSKFDSTKALCHTSPFMNKGEHFKDPIRYPIICQSIIELDPFRFIATEFVLREYINQPSPQILIPKSVEYLTCLIISVGRQASICAENQYLLITLVSSTSWLQQAKPQNPALGL